MTLHVLSIRVKSHTVPGAIRSLMRRASWISVHRPVHRTTPASGDCGVAILVPKAEQVSGTTQGCSADAIAPQGIERGRCPSVVRFGDQYQTVETRI